MSITTTKRDNIASKLVKGIDVDGKITFNWDMASLIGAGGILSTTKDLSNFILENFNTENEALNLTREVTFEIDKGTSVGLGWHILKKENESLWNAHRGEEVIALL